MPSPTLPSRIEQRGNGSANLIPAAQIWTFRQVAPVTRPCEIVGVVAATVLLCADMLNMKLPKRNFIVRELAVFATITGAQPHNLAQRRVHYEVACLLKS